MLAPAPPGFSEMASSKLLGGLVSVGSRAGMQIEAFNDMSLPRSLGITDQPTAIPERKHTKAQDEAVHA